MTADPPERYPEWVEWLLALLLLVPLIFFGLAGLLIVLPAAALIGFVWWGLGTRRRR